MDYRRRIALIVIARSLTGDAAIQSSKAGLLRLFYALAMTVVICFTMPAKATEFCNVLANHVPRDDVEYKPGAEDVVPADIGGAISQPIIDPIVIPVQIQLQQMEGLDPTLEVDPIVAQLEIYQDGRVLYNGQDISAKTSSLCSQANIVIPEYEPADAIGVNPAEPVPSKPIPPKPDEAVISGQYPPLPEAVEIKRIEIIPVDP